MGLRYGTPKEAAMLPERVERAHNLCVASRADLAPKHWATDTHARVRGTPPHPTLADGSHLMVLDPNGASKINRLRIDTRCLAQDREGLGPAVRNSPATAP